jgi:hypothetical protein
MDRLKPGQVLQYVGCKYIAYRQMGRPPNDTYISPNYTTLTVSGISTILLAEAVLLTWTFSVLTLSKVCPRDTPISLLEMEIDLDLI